MEPDYRQLVYLLEIARSGSFSRAAARLRMSQPALSNSIAQLEARLKTKVLSRGRAGAELTDSGRILIRHAEILQTQMGRAVEEVKLHRGTQLGPLNVGVTPVAAADLVPRALGRLKKEIPSLVVRIHETVFQDGMDGLLKGRLDLMVGPIGVYGSVEGIAERRLTLDPFSVVVRKGHPLSKRKSISLAQLTDSEWVLPSDQSTFHRQLEALFVVAGLSWPDRAIATNSMIAMKALVMHGDFVAIMPKQLVQVEQNAGLLETVRLAEASQARALGISWAHDRKRSSPAEALMRHLADCARE